MNRTMMQRTMVITALVIAAGAFQACTTLPRRADDALRISKKGITVLVDSSLLADVRADRPVISVPDNGSIAVEADKAAEAVLGSKGYKIDQPVLISVGAWFESGEKLRVQKAAGQADSPEGISKPFVVWPGVTGEPMKVKINDLFAWTHRSLRGDPRGFMDIFPSEGVLLLSCSGRMSDRSPAVQFLLIDRPSGQIVWWEKGRASSNAPEAFGAEVRKLLEELPVQKAGTGR